MASSAPTSSLSPIQQDFTNISREYKSTLKKLSVLKNTANNLKLKIDRFNQPLYARVTLPEKEELDELTKKVHHFLTEFSSLVTAFGHTESLLIKIETAILIRTNIKLLHPFTEFYSPITKSKMALETANIISSGITQLEQLKGYCNNLTKEISVARDVLSKIKNHTLKKAENYIKNGGYNNSISSGVDRVKRYGGPVYRTLKSYVSNLINNFELTEKKQETFPTTNQNTRKNLSESKTQVPIPDSEPDSSSED